jgi:4-aminobutyrate aminotransferase / (S)-3-amino-2-methylpropionate transaminase / 5-aminovalerate transaminase
MRNTIVDIHLSTVIPGPKSIELQERRRSAIPRALAAVLPVFVEKADGMNIEDVDGNQFLDFAGGIGCLNIGHSQAAVVEAIQKQAERFVHTCFMVTPYDGYVRLAELLNDLTPGSFPKKTFFLNSGAEAIENAVKVARAYTKRQAIIAFEDGFHGRTLLAMSLTSKTHPYKTGFGPFAPEIYRLPYANCYRCPYNRTYPSCGIECADRLEEMFVKQVESEAVAAVIFEPVLGEGGFIVPPPEWFSKIMAICRKHGILTIADEIQTGFCRTGTLFTCDRYGVEPDIIVTAKSLSAGMPLAAVTGRAEIMDACGPGTLGGTFGGNPVCCAAALAAWETFDIGDLSRRAEDFGRIFTEVTATWKERYAIIGDIRGIGAMQAIELVTDRATKNPAKQETMEVLAACHQKGLLILSAGTLGNVVRLLAPLIATEEQTRLGLAILEDAIASVNQSFTSAK